MNNNYNFIVALIGKSASGKSSIEQVLENRCNLNRIISTTSRPIRHGETNHVDYHFVSDGEFQQLIQNDSLIEYRYYDTIENGKSSRWHYGIEKSEINLGNNSHVVVVDLQGLKDLENVFGDKVFSIYIDTPEDIRKFRSIARDRNFEEAEYTRRCKDDDIKFKDAENITDITIDNIDFDKCIKEVIFNVEYIKSLIMCGLEDIES